MSTATTRTVKYEDAVYVFSDPACGAECLLCDKYLEADMDEINVHMYDEHDVELDMGDED